MLKVKSIYRRSEVFLLVSLLKKKLKSPFEKKDVSYLRKQSSKELYQLTQKHCVDRARLRGYFALTWHAVQLKITHNQLWFHGSTPNCVHPKQKAHREPRLGQNTFSFLVDFSKWMQRSRSKIWRKLEFLWRNWHLFISATPLIKKLLKTPDTLWQLASVIPAVQQVLSSDTRKQWKGVGVCSAVKLQYECNYRWRYGCVGDSSVDSHCWIFAMVHDSTHTSCTVMQRRRCDLRSATSVATQNTNI